MTDRYLLPTYKRQPVTFVRGEGCWLFDDKGVAYLDALAGVGVNCLGHCHPAVTSAITRQAAQLVHVSNIYHIANQETLGEVLCKTAGMDKVFFGNSGAEANEAAIKLARLFGHRKGVDAPRILVMDGAFHGRTLATLSATANHKVQAGFEPLVSGFVRVPYNDAEVVAKAVRNDASIVAVLVEPVQGEGGVHAPDKGYLAALRKICDEQDLLLMLDEVQTGNGRTGSYFAFQQESMVPDVLTTAKGLGGGFPIGACLVHGKATDLFGPGNHGSTFGGNPLCTAVALAVVQQLNSVIPSVEARATRLCDQLRARLKAYPMVKEVRHRGLMIGISLDRDCAPLVDIAREQKLLINVTAGSVIRLLPPLIISETEIDQLCDRLVKAVDVFAQSQEAA